MTLGFAMPLRASAMKDNCSSSIQADISSPVADSSAVVLSLLDKVKPGTEFHFYVTRHAESCSNWLRETVKLLGDTEKDLVEASPQNQILDPPLTTEGIKNSCEAGKENEVVPDVILSSYLIRAMQTAHYQYNASAANAVVPVPFICETGEPAATRLPTDMPMEPKEQMKKIRALGLHVAEEAILDCWAPTMLERSSQNWTQFLAWVGGGKLNYVLPAERSLVKIALVAHSNQMRTEFGDCKSIWTTVGQGDGNGKPLNNGVVLLKYVVTDAGELARKANDECELKLVGIKQHVTMEGIDDTCIKEIKEQLENKGQSWNMAQVAAEHLRQAATHRPGA